MQSALLDQMTQGVFNRYVQERFQFVGEVACRCRADQSLDRIQETAPPGKPRPSTRPKALFIKSSHRFERIKTTAMGIAAAIGQLGQFPEDGNVDLRAQSCLHLWHGDGSEALKKIQEGLKDEADGFHNVIITPIPHLASVIITFYLKQTSDCDARHNPVPFGLDLMLHFQ